MDLAGPLKNSEVGYKYILVIDYAIKYPEAFLRSINSEVTATELIKVFTEEGIPQ